MGNMIHKADCVLQHIYIAFQVLLIYTEYDLIIRSFLDCLIAYSHLNNSFSYLEAVTIYVDRAVQSKVRFCPKLNKIDLRQKLTI
jgi:hypothetical protein